MPGIVANSVLENGTKRSSLIASNAIFLVARIIIKSFALNAVRQLLHKLTF